MVIDEIGLHLEELRALCDREHAEALSLKTQLGFKELLEALLGPRVDPVESGATHNPCLKASIEGSREPVFQA